MSSQPGGRAVLPRRTDKESEASGATVSDDVRADAGRIRSAGGIAYLALALLAFVEVNLAAAARSGRIPGLPAAASPGPLQAWMRYDSGWYLDIATHGYFFQPGRQSPVAFFPTYPLLMRLGGTVVDVGVAGVLLTLIGGLASVLLFATWCGDRLPRAATVTAVAVLLLYPYSLYLYGAVYADAVFVACAVGAFVLLERGHPWAAGLVGALAAAGRPVGVAVVIGLAVRAVELAGRREQRAVTSPGGWADRARATRDSAVWSLRHLRWSDAGVLLAGAGLAGYLVYQWVAFGTPTAFLATESAPGWDQGSGPKVLLKFAFFYRMLHGNPAQIAQLLLPALVCLGTVLLLPRIRRRFGWGYAAYTAVLVALPVYGTKDFMGTGRYLLPAFPAIAVLAELMTQRLSTRTRRAVLSVSAVLLAVAVALYGLGFEVS